VPEVAEHRISRIWRSAADRIALVLVILWLPFGAFTVFMFDEPYRGGLKPLWPGKIDAVLEEAIFYYPLIWVGIRILRVLSNRRRHAALRTLLDVLRVVPIVILVGWCAIIWSRLRH
jgi:hypothetical protein